MYCRAREVLKQSQGVRVVDDPLNNQYPMPLTATGSFDVEVSTYNHYYYWILSIPTVYMPYQYHDSVKSRTVIMCASSNCALADSNDNMHCVHVTACCCVWYDIMMNTQVGRIRANDVFGDHGLDLFVCGDQLLRGAALNAVIIAEAMSKLPANA
jgi:hypothetical protein